MNELYDLAPGTAPAHRITPIAALLQGDDPLHPPAPRFGIGWLLAALVWVVFYAGAQSLFLNRPLDRAEDLAAARYAAAARNLLHDGFAAMQGGVYLLPGELPPEQRQFHPAHPPGFVWALAGWMRLFGNSDLALRAMPAAFTLFNLLLLFVLVGRLFNPGAALATVAVYSILPMTFYFAQTLHPAPLLTTLILATSLGYLGWVRARSKLALMSIYAFAALGCWTDWRTYVFCAVLAVLHAFTLRGRRRWLVSLGLIATPALVFAAFSYYLHLHGTDAAELLDRARAQVAATALHNAGPIDRWSEIARDRSFLRSWLIDWFTAPALALAGVGALLWLSWSTPLARDGAGGKVALRLLLAIVAMQLAFTLAFADSALRLPHWQYHLALPVAMLSAGLCAGLTVAQPRTVAAGVCDRLAWAIAALIPLLAVTPLKERLPPVYLPWPPGIRDLATGAPIGSLREMTAQQDLIFTDTSRAPLLAWYADRAVTHRAEYLDAGFLKAAVLDQPPETRSLYLWTGEGADSLFSFLVLEYGPPYRAGDSEVFVLRGAPDPAWNRPSAATQPTTAPAQ